MSIETTAAAAATTTNAAKPIWKIYENEPSHRPLPPSIEMIRAFLVNRPSSISSYSKGHPLTHPVPKPKSIVDISDSLCPLRVYSDGN